MMKNLKLNSLTNDDYEQISNFNAEQSYLDDWEDPLSFDSFDLPKFDASIFPEWLQNYVQAVAESTQTPVDMASMAAFAVLSVSATKNFIVNPYGDWKEPLNTYTLTLMSPANRKSSVFREMTRPITFYQAREQERLESEITQRDSKRRTLMKRMEYLEGKFAKEGKEEYQLEIDKVQDELHHLPPLYLPTFITDDATPETLVTLMKQNRERIAVLSAESGLFDMVKGRYSGQVNLEVYLKGHVGDYLRVDRRDRTEILESPALTIGVFGQNDVIKDLPRIFQGRGLMARFLYSIPKDIKGFRNVRPLPIPDNTREKYSENIISLMNWSTDDPIKLTLSTEADVLFRKFQENNERELRESGQLSEISEWGGKIVGNIARLSGLLHIAHHVGSTASRVPVEISADTINKAMNLESYFIQHAKAAFGYMKHNPNLDDGHYLLKVITKKYKSMVEKTDRKDIAISYRDVQQSVKNRFDSKKLQILLKDLEERSFIRMCSEESIRTKPKKYLQVNPYI
jgi:replicative DNA helicase